MRLQAQSSLQVVTIEDGWTTSEVLTPLAELCSTVLAGTAQSQIAI